MVLKLDPGIPLVWRDPFSLQFGVDPARIVLREVSPAQERMIAALSSGVSRSGLGMIARSAGAEERDVDRLLEAVGPVLVGPLLVGPLLVGPLLVGREAEPPRTGSRRPEPSQAGPPRTEPPPPNVAIVGTGVTVERIACAIAETGAHVRVTPVPSEEPGDEPCDLGIAVGHFVLDPQSYGFWLRRDLPHLPVIFGDASATVGPLVEPGTGPCLYCLEHHRRDADPAWSAIASQLWGRRSSAETPLLSREVAALAARIAVRRLGAAGEARGIAAAATSFRLSAQTGEVTRREWMPHPECGCLAVPQAAAAIAASGTASAARRGNDSAAVPLRGSRPRPPRTAGAVGELA
jgi:bacteriocin biosynthesis cyclodehydratase domain-containing protein